MSNEDNIHLISFNSEGLSIEQEIVIANVGAQADTTIDDVVNGLNSGELNTTLDYDSTVEEQWIRDNNGVGVAVIMNQKVTVTGEGFKDFNQPDE